MDEEDIGLSWVLFAFGLICLSSIVSFCVMKPPPDFEIVAGDPQYVGTPTPEYRK